MEQENYKNIVKVRLESYEGENIVAKWLQGAYKMGVDDFIKYGFPDIETVSMHVHYAWMQSKKQQGVTTRLSESGEELMVPYSKLSEQAKDLDRNTVIAVYKAINDAIEEEKSFPSAIGKEGFEG